MTAMRFNPITYSHKLQESGMNQKLADVQAEELANFINNDICTKQDLKELEINLELKINNEMKSLELRLSSLIVRAGTSVIFLLGALQTLFHFFPK